MRAIFHLVKKTTDVPSNRWVKMAAKLPSLAISCHLKKNKNWNLVDLKRRLHSPHLASLVNKCLQQGNYRLNSSHFVKPQNRVKIRWKIGLPVMKLHPKVNAKTRKFTSFCVTRSGWNLSTQANESCVRVRKRTGRVCASGARNTAQTIQNAIPRLTRVTLREKSASHSKNLNCYQPCGTSWTTVRSSSWQSRNTLIEAEKRSSSWGLLTWDATYAPNYPSCLGAQHRCQSSPRVQIPHTNRGFWTCVLREAAYNRTIARIYFPFFGMWRCHC